MSTTIRAKKDLYNKGKCFTKNKTYIIKRDIISQSSLIDISIINDLGEPHIIGQWWRDFEIVEEEEDSEYGEGENYEERYLRNNNFNGANLD